MRIIALLLLGICGCSATEAAPAPVADTSTDTTVEDVAITPDAETAATGGTLGAKCAADGDCATGLLCWSEKTGRDRWPSGGLCTAPCGKDDECTALEAGARCWEFDGTKFCVAGCDLGGTLTGASTPLDPTKCHGRTELGCWKPTAAIDPFCAPSCNGDAACPGGKCDPGKGLCTKVAAGTTDSIGLGYQLDGGTAIECSTGYRRLDTPTGVLFCTALCTLGVVPSCGWDGSGKARAACVFGPTGARAGDLGFCGELCDCDSDCRAPLRCRKLEAKPAATYGRQGLCGGTNALAPACGDAGTDGSTD